MIVLGWIFALLAIAVQGISIVLTFRQPAESGRRSQILFVPCLLWYVGLVIRGENGGFFAEDKVAEFGFVLLIHCAICVIGSLRIRHKATG